MKGAQRLHSRKRHLGVSVATASSARCRRHHSPDKPSLHALTLPLPVCLPACSHMLASCTGATKVVMMDVRGFKEKADR